MKNILNTQNSIIADTGFWIAIGSRDDKHHRRAIEVASSLIYDPITTWPVITETFYLLQRNQGTHTARSFLVQLDQNDIDIFQTEPEHLPRLLALTEQYQNLPMDLADASLVILAEALGHGRILSTDQRDFNAYHWKNHEPFENLLLTD